MKLVTGIFVLVTFTTASAQTTPQKIGHANWQYIFGQLKEYKQVETELKTYESQLQAQLIQKTRDFETKLKSFNELPDNTPEAIRRDKESELAFLRETIEKFRETAQTSMQRKQSELLTPILAKVGKAIEEVAVENGYSYILNPQMMGGGELLLYGDEKYNISLLVLKKLGVEPKVE